MKEKETWDMSVAVRYVVGAMMVGVFFWVVFVVLIVSASLIRALEWLADSYTENLARFAVRAGSMANTAWSRSHLGERLSDFRAATQRSSQKTDLPAARLKVAHALRQFVAGHGLFRS
jgi:hypothetical protein